MTFLSCRKKDLIRGQGIIQNTYSCVQGEEVSQLMGAYALTPSLFIFLAACFSCGFLHFCSSITFIQICCVHQKHLSLWNCLYFSLYYFCETKSVKTLESFLKENLRSPILYYCDTLLWKHPVLCSTGKKICRACLILLLLLLILHAISLAIS